MRNKVIPKTPKRLPRPCRICGKRFQPNGLYQKCCQNCIDKKGKYERK